MDECYNCGSDKLEAIPVPVGERVICNSCGHEYCDYEYTQYRQETKAATRKLLDALPEMMRKAGKQ